jgi:NADH:ubiquinone oxidoreductase subunit F (NADH-binding)
MSASIPDVGQTALLLERRLVEIASTGMDNQTCEEVAQLVADAPKLTIAGLIACGRALHAAAAVCYARGDGDAEILHDLAQQLIGRAFDRVALAGEPAPVGALKH